MKKLRIGIIGAGSLAGIHIDAYRCNPHVEVTALCDINYERAKQRADELGIKQAYDDYRKMLESDDIDAVSVITWNNTHMPISIAALEAGKHVLCEKPPAINSIETLKMEEAAKQSGKVLMFGFVRRFDPKTRLIKEFIDKGDLGEIYYVKTGYLRRAGNPGGWFANKDISGGGPLIDLGIHIIDLAMYLMGKLRPVSVLGSTYHRLGNRSHIKGITGYRAADYCRGVNNVEDLANAMIKFDNGASLYVETSWTLNIKSDIIYMDLFGDMGGVKIEPILEIYSECNGYLTDTRPVLDSYTFDMKKAFSGEIDHFVDCIINGSPCISPAEDGTKIMKILDAIYKSSRTGELVRL